MEKIVVSIQPTILQNTADGTYAVRFVELGLTAYGRTEADALVRCKKLFNRFV